MFEAAIPGQSLTTAPGRFPYERPPEISDPEEALQMHLTRLAEEDKVSSLVDMMELGIDVKTLTEGILRSAVAEGIHSVDTSLIIAPAIHEFIKQTAEDAGIEYDEGLEENDSEKQRTLQVAKAKKLLEKAGDITIPQEDETASATPDVQPESTGFMKRRV